jgi:hypothetical protein
MRLLFWISVAAIVAVVIVLVYRYSEAGRRRRLFRGQACSFNAWFDKHYSKVGHLLARDKVERVLTSLARQLEVAPTNLLPEDRINEECSLEGVPLDDTIEAFDEALSDEFGETIAIPAHWHTLDDIIRGLCMSDGTSHASRDGVSS